MSQLAVGQIQRTPHGSPTSIQQATESKSKSNNGLLESLNLGFVNLPFPVTFFQANWVRVKDNYQVKGGIYLVNFKVNCWVIRGQVSVVLPGKG